jgi:hypothetical protein
MTTNPNPKADYQYVQKGRSLFIVLVAVFVAFLAFAFVMAPGFFKVIGIFLCFLVLSPTSATGRGFQFFLGVE